MRARPRNANGVHRPLVEQSDGSLALPCISREEGASIEAILVRALGRRVESPCRTTLGQAIRPSDVEEWVRQLGLGIAQNAGRRKIADVTPRSRTVGSRRTLRATSTTCRGRALRSRVCTSHTRKSRPWCEASRRTTWRFWWGRRLLPAPPDGRRGRNGHGHPHRPPRPRRAGAGNAAIRPGCAGIACPKHFERMAPPVVRRIPMKLAKMLGRCSSAQKRRIAAEPDNVRS